MAYIFMGTPAFAVPTLKALHEAGLPIAAVYTQPPRPAGRGQKETPSPVHQYALRHGIPVETPLSLKSAETQARIARHRAEAAIVAAYGLILPGSVLQAFPRGCINVHPSLLPRWRGAAPIQRALMAGDEETGICIMQMDEGLDTGGIVLTERFTIPSGMNAGALHDTLAAMAGPLVLEALEGIRAGSLSATAQAETGVAYAPKISKDECRIDWNVPAPAIRNRIRALSPTPGAYFEYRDEPIKILDAETAGAVASGFPGEVIDDRLTIACGEGTLRPLFVKRPGKQAMPVLEMLRGYAIPPGALLA